MVNPVIEHKVTFPVEHGEITSYETNTPCAGLSFNFQRPMIAMMLSGEKDIKWEEDRLSLKPKSVFIPPSKEEMKVSIAEASANSPTKCIVLDVADEFIAGLYYEIVERWNPEWLTLAVTPKTLGVSHLTTDATICNSYLSLYDNMMYGKGAANLSFLLNLKLKELLYFLLQDKSQQIALNAKPVEENGPIVDVINYINQNFQEKISIPALAKMALMSSTNFYKKFKSLFGCTPADYLINKRINHSKLMLATTPYPISKVLEDAGFRSFEYFCRKFKEIEGVTPMEFRLLKSKG